MTDYSAIKTALLDKQKELSECIDCAEGAEDNADLEAFDPNEY